MQMPGLLQRFLPEEMNRRATLTFLVDSITCAHRVNEQNWNLNFGTDGNHIRFNVGHVLCCSREVLRLRIYGLSEK